MAGYLVGYLHVLQEVVKVALSLGHDIEAAMLDDAQAPLGADYGGRQFGYVATHCKEATGELDKPVAPVGGMKYMIKRSCEQLCRLGIEECDVLNSY